jgi:hypothetical protein
MSPEDIGVLSGGVSLQLHFIEIKELGTEAGPLWQINIRGTDQALAELRISS